MMEISRVLSLFFERLQLILTNVLKFSFSKTQRVIFIQTRQVVLYKSEDRSVANPGLVNCYSDRPITRWRCLEVVRDL